MPVRDIFHKGDAAALDRIGDDHGWAVDLGPSLGNGLVDMVKIMAIDDAYVPAECAPFVGKGIQRHHRLGGSVGLQTIAIREGDEPREPVLVGEESRLPNLSLLLFPVPAEGENIVRGILQHSGESESAGGGQTQTECAGGGIESGGLWLVGVALQMGTGSTKRLQITGGEVAAVRQRGIENR